METFTSLATSTQIQSLLIEIASLGINKAGYTVNDDSKSKAVAALGEIVSGILAAVAVGQTIAATKSK